MTFPTKADIEFFKEAKRIQELWEPKPLDFIYSLADKEVFSLTQPLIGWGPMPKNWVWLPRQGQLQEMLEERGHDIQTYILVLDQSEHRVKASAWPKKGILIERFGPTASIALGKCLLEVLCVQHPEDASASEGKEE